MPNNPSNQESPKADQSAYVMRPCPACGLLLDRSVVVCPRDGTAITGAIEQDSNFLNKYEFLGTIGSGGMGVIYRARQVVMDKVVAIKMLHHHLVSPEAFRRFQLEGHAAGMLSHPNIIAVYDLGITDSDQPYMVMEYVDGITLAELIGSGQAIAMGRFAKIFLQVCDGMAHAHSRNVLHRDLKPSNIMLMRGNDGTEQVRIMDFGIAKIIDDTVFGGQKLTKTGDAVGSPMYMSPEQGRGTNVDARSDLYSLGCVMYEVLAGKPPFAGSTSMETLLKHFNELPVPLSKIKSRRIEPQVEEIVMKLLQKDPSQRYQSMVELRNDLQTLLAAEGRGIGRFVIPEQRRRRSTAIIVSIVILGVVGACILKGPQLLRAGNAAMAQWRTRNSRDHQITQHITDNGTHLDASKDKLGFEATDDDLARVNAPNLTFLDLSGSKITDNGLASFFCPNLVSLKLDNTELSTLGALNKYDKLENLSLKNDLNLSEDAFKNIGDRQGLKKIDLSGSYMFHPAWLSYLYSLWNIRELRLKDCYQVTPKDAHEVRSGSKGDRREVITEDSPFGNDADYKICVSSGEHYLEQANFAVSANQPNLALYEAAELAFADDKNDPKLTEAYVAHGNCLFSMHKFKEMESLYTDAIKTVSSISPNSMGLPLLYSNQALAMDMQDKPDAYKLREQAAALFKAQKCVNSDAIDNMAALGTEYSKLGQTANAIAHLTEAFDMAKEFQNPDLVTKIASNLADALAGAGLMDKAISYYERATDVYARSAVTAASDNNAQCEAKIATCYQKMGQPLKAQEYLAHCLDRPANKDARATQLKTMVTILNGEGKSQEAKLFSDKLDKLQSSGSHS